MDPIHERGLHLVKWTMGHELGLWIDPELFRSHFSALLSLPTWGSLHFPNTLSFTLHSNSTQNSPKLFNLKSQEVKAKAIRFLSLTLKFLSWVSINVYGDHLWFLPLIKPKYLPLLYLVLWWVEFHNVLQYVLKCLYCDALNNVGSIC